MRYVCSVDGSPFRNWDDLISYEINDIVTPNTEILKNFKKLENELDEMSFSDILKNKQIIAEYIYFKCNKDIELPEHELDMIEIYETIYNTNISQILINDFKVENVDIVKFIKDNKEYYAIAFSEYKLQDKIVETYTTDYDELHFSHTKDFILYNDVYFMEDIEEVNMRSFLIFNIKDKDKSSKFTARAKLKL